MKNLYKCVLVLLALSSASLSRSQVSLSSYTSASAVIFLDFDGHTTSGTMWNVYGPFTCNSAGLDNAGITEVFNRVAEDYRPFNINVSITELSKLPGL